MIFRSKIKGLLISIKLMHKVEEDYSGISNSMFYAVDAHNL